MNLLSLLFYSCFSIRPARQIVTCLFLFGFVTVPHIRQTWSLMLAVSGRITTSWIAKNMPKQSDRQRFIWHNPSYGCPNWRPCLSFMTFCPLFSEFKLKIRRHFLKIFSHALKFSIPAQVKIEAVFRRKNHCFCNLFILNRLWTASVLPPLGEGRGGAP